ncbi:MAG: hypothetical protein WC492_01560 [Candidatus Micrarchaeia archaeon]
MPPADDFIKKSLYGSVASRAAAKRAPPVMPARKTIIKHGKKVVFVTPFANAAKEEAIKQEKSGYKAEIKREKDDTGKYVFVVYIFE